MGFHLNKLLLFYRP